VIADRDIAAAGNWKNSIEWRGTRQLADGSARNVSIADAPKRRILRLTDCGQLMRWTQGLLACPFKPGWRLRRERSLFCGLVAAAQWTDFYELAEAFHGSQRRARIASKSCGRTDLSL